MSVVMLNPQERAALEHIASHAILMPGARRAQALLWLANGKSIPGVAKALSVSRQTIYNWIAGFRQRRHDTDIVMHLIDKPRSGRPSYRPRVAMLPPQAIDPLITSAIGRAPRECGYYALLWTAKLLRQYLQDAHHVTVTVASVRSALARLEASNRSVTVQVNPHHNNVALS
jgi:transposase